ncbi:MAG: ATP-binding cassette domain-containing protein [Candidatus Schekmanbacteria bacterium]|nr:ATP-binding cassette domain-containing protein [Candidatus Schekmanbacteria bacterium]
MTSDASSGPAILIEDLYKQFEGHEVLRGIDLHVDHGESLVIIGGSGAGKSVLMKHIIGLLTPDRGEVTVLGKSIGKVKQRELYELRKSFGKLFQGAALFDSLPIWENVGFSLLEHTRMRRSEVRRAASETLRQVGLPNVEDRYPAELSVGQRKRVGLARAIVNKPRILLCDEPTTGLDPIMGDVIDNLIVRMRKQLGVTTFTITHDMKSASKIADRIAMLYKGKIIQVDTPEVILRSENDIVRNFVQGKRPSAEKGE